MYERNSVTCFSWILLITGRSITKFGVFTRISKPVTVKLIITSSLCIRQEKIWNRQTQGMLWLHYDIPHGYETTTEINEEENGKKIPYGQNTTFTIATSGGRKWGFGFGVTNNSHLFLMGKTPKGSIETERIWLMGDTVLQGKFQYPPDCQIVPHLTLTVPVTTVDALRHFETG